MTDAEAKLLAAHMNLRIERVWPRIEAAALKHFAGSQGGKLPPWFLKCQDLRAQGMEDWRIAETLNAQGYRTAQGKTLDRGRIANARWRWRKLAAQAEVK